MKFCPYDFGVHDFEPQVMNTLKDKMERNFDDTFHVSKEKALDRTVYTYTDGEDTCRLIFISGVIIGYLDFYREIEEYYNFYDIPRLQSKERDLLESRPCGRLFLCLYSELTSLFGVPPSEGSYPSGPAAIAPYRQKIVELPGDILLWFYMNYDRLQNGDRFNVSRILRCFGLPHYWRQIVLSSLWYLEQTLVLCSCVPRRRHEDVYMVNMEDFNHFLAHGLPLRRGSSSKVFGWHYQYFCAITFRRVLELEKAGKVECPTQVRVARRATQPQGETT